MKFICFSYEMYCGPVAQKLIEEGNEVFFGQINNKKDTLLESELDGFEDEEPELKKRRLSLYKGVIPKYPASRLLSALQMVDKPEEYFVLTDINNSFKFVQKAKDYGAIGFFPSEEDRQMEVNRDDGKKIVEQNYPGVYLKDYKTFTTAQEGIDFLQDNPNIYVIKSLGDSGETIVPKQDDPAVANKVIIDALTKDGKAYEENGYLLEQKILDAVEVTPEVIFWDGTPVMYTIDLETKTKDSNELGINVGCGHNLIIQTKPDDPINKIAFPQFVYDMAKQRKGMFVWDIGILIDKKDGKPYFTEFCPNRVGWDAFPTELAMAADEDRVVTPFFEKLIKGQNPLNKKYGVGVRFFNENQDKDRYVEGGLSISWEPEINKQIFLYDVKREKDGKLVTAGYEQDLGVITGVGDTIEEAINSAYDAIKKISFRDIAYRPLSDFVSMDYSQSIFNRLSYLVEQGLITDVDFKQL